METARKCECFTAEPSGWITHAGATEPASMIEYNPECPEHGQQLNQEGAN